MLETNTAYKTDPLLAEAIERASHWIAPVWPIRAFVARNPLAGLETLPFPDAVREGRRLFGGDGYLPESTSRSWYRAGRISDRDLIQAIRRLKVPALPSSLSPYGDANDVIRRLLVAEPRPLTDEWIGILEDKLRDPFAKGHLTDIGSLARTRLEADIRQLTTVAAWLGPLVGRDLVKALNEAVIPYVEAFLDDGQAAWTMPGREQGFYRAWRDLALVDRSQAWLGVQQAARRLPEEAADALLDHLTQLGITERAYADYLKYHLAQLPGWAGYIKWRVLHPDDDWQHVFPIDLVQYLAVRLFYEVRLVEQISRDVFHVPGRVDALHHYFSRHPEEYYGWRFNGGHGNCRRGDDRCWEHEARRLFEREQQRELRTRVQAVFDVITALEISEDTVRGLGGEVLGHWADWASWLSADRRRHLWLEALEEHYQDVLAHRLANPRDASTSETGPAPTQVAFCMDVRSEGIRRHLEAQGAYETIGAAGFFGIPMTYQEWMGHRPTHRYPAILTPQMAVREEVAEALDHQEASRVRQWWEVKAWLHHLYRRLKQHVVTPFAMVESTGWTWGVGLLARTVEPGRVFRWLKKLGLHVRPTVPTELATDTVMEETADLVAAALTGLGIARRQGRLVVLLGHRGHSDNNPWASALQCGAAGGHPGGANARALAWLANQTAIRHRLTARGIELSPDTWFLAGEHNTTTDEVTLFDRHRVPASLRSEVEQLQRDLAEAGRLNAVERSLDLPGAPAKPSIEAAIRHAYQRSVDWAETRPEWGLASHFAIVIGRRQLTAGHSWGNRVFLHSYDYREDTSGRWLMNIVNGPLIVAHWINMEYYFSTVDNAVYGSGSKVTANVVGGLGVMQGSHSDLKPGLPWQSVRDTDGAPYHEPMRLLVVIEAPRERIQGVLDALPLFRQLVHNAWIHLLMYDPVTEELVRYQPEVATVASI
ncbi:conserved hypothetical protein [Sulfobacillus acidophilus TPY]|uniref:Probable inorganic carbon transporter subunit DabA n=1 Tax=Sulfobacillus acidophilus (strain ATCC 700253 / DSM 10332 / NAL) TaxID=679936 RepID=G8TSM2_SULAD|nr:conserved hypothetical protein [Sulfobacillus acidophilus TPY]AEW04399.1 UPF0753 protein [Sulfobacillus acidophilus DSM 10332]